jgi:succinate-semialdehyde dehydrogenase/glutarate-semialdehyde dehydrogenase
VNNFHLKSINPKNNLLLNSWSIISQNHVESTINDVSNSQSAWKILSIDMRIGLIEQLANILQNKIKELSLLMADEMGKPISQGDLEIKKCIWLCDYYVKNAKINLLNKNIKTEYYKSYVSYHPIGLIFGIMPWNFPFWQVFRFSIPALIVGNGILLKHASNVQGCANAIERCFKEAGFYKNIFKNLQIPSSMVGKVIENNKIAGIAITGSTIAGKEVAKKAGEFLKKIVLELGGNDPYLILNDANIDMAVNACVDGRLLNTGQSCISAKRLIVTKKNIGIFTKKIVCLLEKKIIGDPYNEVDLGPLSSVSARNNVHNMVLESINLGAKLLLGGKIPSGEGAYYPITVLVDVIPGMPAFDDEIFGPVFSIIKAENDDKAIKLANESKFGLGAAVFTSDIEVGEKIANEQLQSGLCFVNDYVKSDPRLPFGGIKMSGYGRELSSYGLKEFVNVKTVVVETSK